MDDTTLKFHELVILQEALEHHKLTDSFKLSADLQLSEKYDKIHNKISAQLSAMEYIAMENDELEPMGVIKED